MAAFLGDARRLGVVASLAALVLLGGCAGFRGAPARLYTSDELGKNDRMYAEAIEASASAATGEDQRRVRDRFITVRTALIDYQYGLFRTDLYEGRVGADVGVDLATLGLNGVGAALASTQVKTIAAGLSAFLIGGKASVDKNVYFDRTLPALLEQMDAGRATVRRRILDSMINGTDRYPLMQAAADVEDYFRAGSIAGAIAGITTQATAEKKDAVGLLEKRLGSPGFEFQSAAASNSGTRLQACVEQPGSVGKERRATMIDWLNARGFNTSPPFGYSDFFTQPGNEPLRRQALLDALLMARLKGCP